MMAVTAHLPPDEPRAQRLSEPRRPRCDPRHTLAVTAVIALSFGHVSHPLSVDVQEESAPWPFPIRRGDRTPTKTPSFPVPNGPFRSITAAAMSRVS
jgi:hypothetical protein